MNFRIILHRNSFMKGELICLNDFEKAKLKILNPLGSVLTSNNLGKVAFPALLKIIKLLM